jgi:hypothetical protein
MGSPYPGGEPLCRVAALSAGSRRPGVTQDKVLTMRRCCVQQRLPRRTNPLPFPTSDLSRPKTETRASLQSPLQSTPFSD